MTFLEKLSLIKSIDIKKISFLNINALKINMLSESKVNFIINKLKVKITKKEILIVYILGKSNKLNIMNLYISN